MYVRSRLIIDLLISFTAPLLTEFPVSLQSLSVYFTPTSVRPKCPARFRHDLTTPAECFQRKQRRTATRRFFPPRKLHGRVHRVGHHLHPPIRRRATAADHDFLRSRQGVCQTLVDQGELITHCVES